MLGFLKQKSRAELAEMADMQLLAQYHSGNEEAIGILFQRHYNELFHLAWSVLIDKVYADEIISQVLEEYLKTPRRKRKMKYNITSNTRGFLRTTVIRRSIDYNRKKSNQVRKVSIDLEDSRQLPADATVANSSSPFDRLGEFEAGQLMERILDRLVGKERDIFDLHAQGYTHEEICTLLQITTPRNVSSALYNARKKAREVLFT